VFIDLASLDTTQYDLFEEHIATTDPETICEKYKTLATVHEQVKNELTKRNSLAFQRVGTLNHIFGYVGGKRRPKTTKQRRGTTKARTFTRSRSC
jgi:hypothetical protein